MNVPCPPFPDAPLSPRPSPRTADRPPSPIPLTLADHRALRWGDHPERALLAVHGMSGSKSDPMVAAVARGADLAGWTTISVDLPGHGDRHDRAALNPWTYAEELAQVAREVAGAHDQLALFACSLGAFLSLHALADAPLERALLAAPLVDMEAFIARKMFLQGVSERELRSRRHIALADGQSLDWGYLSWVRRHRVRWAHPTAVLHGASDAIVPLADVEAFTRATGAQLQVIPAGHYLHTDHDLGVVRRWVTSQLADVCAREAVGEGVGEGVGPGGQRSPGSPVRR